MNFYESLGTQKSKPPELEVVGVKVFVRKNIKKIMTENGEMWSYEEAYGTIADYANYLRALSDIGQTDLEISQIESERAITDLEIEVEELKGGA